MTQYVLGVKELQKKLTNVGEKASHKVMAKALRKAMVPLRNEAIKNAPKGDEAHKTYKGRLVAPGYLKQNIKLKKMRAKNKRFAGYTLAARGEAWYGQLIETGWRPGGRSKAVKAASRRFVGGLSDFQLKKAGDTRGGKVKGRPWLGKAWRKHKDSVKQRMLENIAKELKKV